jgi:YVTN family beta-propeller protein
MLKTLAFAAIAAVVSCGLAGAQVRAQNAYITNPGGAVLVIDTATNTVTATIPVGGSSLGVAVSPDGGTVYVTDEGSNTVSVIAAATNTVTATIPVGVGAHPIGVAVSPNGSTVYVANEGSNTVSVIAAATNTVTATIATGGQPFAFGIFIQPAPQLPRFAGTPGFSNCYGVSVSALARQYGGLNRAAAALGYASVDALQNAILAYCQA